jgi:hypothetical protein
VPSFVTFPFVIAALVARALIKSNQNAQVTSAHKTNRDAAHGNITVF